MVFVSALEEIFRRPSTGDVITELIMLVAPLWIAVLVGVLVGWAWKPKWAHFNGELIPRKDSSAHPISSSPSPSAMMVLSQLSSCSIIPTWTSLRLQLPTFISGISDSWINKDNPILAPPPRISTLGCSSTNVEKPSLVDENDLKHIYRLTEETDGGPAWIQMMNRSTNTMSYQAWRRDPERGLPQYRSRTVFENASPEMVRDFFWDDEFRLKWDDMLLHAETLQECQNTGTMVVQWVRKFPFFCSDREYIICRRIWRSGNTFYCVTKGVPDSSVPRREKPRRVDLYYSSWCIRPVESSGTGQLPACEVLLFHHEDMGIPWEIAKLGVRQGMWGAVKKIDPALRVYQNQRASGATHSRCALMAKINTRVSSDRLRLLENASDSSEVESRESSPEKPFGRNIPRYLVVGGAIALACSVDRGLLTKAVIFGVARQFAKIGRRV